MFIVKSFETQTKITNKIFGASRQTYTLALLIVEPLFFNRIPLPIF